MPTGDVKKLNVWVALEDLKVIIKIIIFNIFNLIRAFKTYPNTKIVENILSVHT